MRSCQAFLSATLTLLLSAPSSHASGEETARVHLFFSGEIGGTFEPCGCAGGPAGGVARRIGFVRDLLGSSPEPSLQFDAGNYFAAPGPQASSINRFLEESLGAIPVSVLNLASEDLYWWPQLARLQAEDLHLISTNLQPRRSGVPVPRSYAVLQRTVRFPSGNSRTLKIGFLGLTDPQAVKPNSGFRAEDPVAAVRSALPEVSREADLIVVLWDLIRPQGGIPPNSPLRAVAELSPKIALIVTTEKRYILYRPVTLGKVVLLSSVERGRFLGHVVLEVGENGVPVVGEPSFHEMKEGVPEDADWRSRQDRLSAQLR